MAVGSGAEARFHPASSTVILLRAMPTSSSRRRLAGLFSGGARRSTEIGVWLLEAEGVTATLRRHTTDAVSTKATPPFWVSQRAATALSSSQHQE